MYTQYCKVCKWPDTSVSYNEDLRLLVCEECEYGLNYLEEYTCQKPLVTPVIISRTP